MILAPTANPLLQELEAAAAVTHKIRNLLNTIPEYVLSQQRVAQSLNMTSRTLRRKLALEGNSSIRQIVESSLYCD